MEGVERVERRWHEQVWALANDSSRVERAIAEGRDLAYAVLSRIPNTDEHDTVRYMAQRWLDTFGLDPLRESGLRRD